MVERPNAFFVNRQVAEFNTSADSLTQLANMEWTIDMLFIRLKEVGKSKDSIIVIEMIYQYIVESYADRLYSLAWSKLRERVKKDEIPYDPERLDTFEDWEINLKDLYKEWTDNKKENYPRELVNKLRMYKRWLYCVKQDKIKVGIPMRTEMTAQQKLKKVIGV